MSDSEDEEAVVIDNGSGTCRAGFAGDEIPRVSFPTVVGRPHYRSARNRPEMKEYYVGNEAQQMRDYLSLRYPIKHGIITDWDDMEKIWHHIFHRALARSPQDLPVLLTEPQLNPMTNREMMAEVMFESFNVPAILLQNQALLSFYTNGLYSGVVVDIGDGVVDILPVYEGFVMKWAATRLDYAGRDLTNYLAAMLRDRSLFFSTSSEMEIVREMKERLAYVALDFEAEVLKAAVSPRSVEKDFCLPDGQSILVGSERFRCSEPLFQPSLIEHTQPGIHEAVFNAIMMCGLDVRRDLWSRIVLCGGGATFPGLVERMRRELGQLAPCSVPVSVVAAPECGMSAWVGGSIVSSLGNYRLMWTTRSEYDEYGPSIAHRKNW